MTRHRNRPKASISFPKLAVVGKVIDGDTLLLKGGEKVRLIGVDADELHFSKKQRAQRDIGAKRKLGKKASEFVKNLIKPGDNIRLEYDRKKTDRYGRILAYVYLRNGTFLNARIIKEGYARTLTTLKFRCLDDFTKYETEARDNKRGLWSE